MRDLFDLIPKKSMSQKSFLARTKKNKINLLFMDSDRDGVINGLDCYPFDRRRHGKIGEFVDKRLKHQFDYEPLGTKKSINLGFANLKHINSSQRRFAMQNNYDQFRQSRAGRIIQQNLGTEDRQAMPKYISPDSRTPWADQRIEQRRSELNRESMLRRRYIDRMRHDGELTDQDIKDMENEYHQNINNY